MPAFVHHLHSSFHMVYNMLMYFTVQTTNGDASATGALMHDMVAKYWQDMIPFVHLSLYEMYDMIKNLPFRPDPIDLETLQRPLYTMRGVGSGGDCDDKSIAFASYLTAIGIPYRFIAARAPTQEHLHHVFTELYTAGMWVTADCTYSFNCLGRGREKYEQLVII
jgi:hypothetical protein